MEEADYRPMGLAQGPDGSLYISESKKGKIWRIMFSGEREGYGKENLSSMNERLKKSNIKQPTQEVDILDWSSFPPRPCKDLQLYPLPLD